MHYVHAGEGGFIRSLGYVGPILIEQGAVVRDNTATRRDGGFYSGAGTAASFTISGASVVANNSAVQDGGFAWLNLLAGPVSISGGSVVGGCSALSGGAFYVLNGGPNMTVGISGAQTQVCDNFAAVAGVGRGREVYACATRLGQ